MDAKIAPPTPGGRGATPETGALVVPPPGRDVARDVRRFGSAVALGAALGAVQVFVIPRRLGVEEFGAWRLFLVYAGYVGVLHFGVADGAFLRWAGRAAGHVRREWRRVARTVLALSALVCAAALLALPLAGPGVPRLLLLGFAACALCVNSATLAGYALQAVGEFREAGRVAVLAPATFVISVLVLRVDTVWAVIAAYVAGFAVAALVGAVLVTRLPHDAQYDAAHEPTPRAARLAREGLPVLGANLAAGIAQFGDRILVSVAVPLASFAQYGFASSVMVAASTTTQALSRVALSHAARRDEAERARFLDGFHDLIVVLSGVGFAGVPAFERLVASALPAYVSALPIVRALVVGAPFAVGVHVVLVGTLQSYGRVRRQLALELIGLAAVLLGCGGGLLAARPLWQVAAGATIAAMATWAIGLGVVRRAVSAARFEGAARFALVAAAQGTALLAALALTPRPVVRTLAYVALAAGPTLVAARAARRGVWRR